MRIHIISNSLRMNSGFSNVARYIATGLRRLGHEVTMTGLQTAYLPEYSYGIECLPIDTVFVDETTQVMLNIQKTNPDIVLCIHQADADMNHLFKLFPKTFCILPDSPILTLDKGVQKIKDIKIGDKVLTHKGRFMRVSQVMKREYYGDMIKIFSHKLKIPIILTPEHKVLAVKTSPCIGDSGVDRCRPAKCYRYIDGYQRKRCKYIYGEEPWRKYNTQWIDAKNLTKGDWVVYPKSNDKIIDIEKIRIIDYIDDLTNVFGDNFYDNTRQSDLFGEFINRTIASGSGPSKSIPAEIKLDKNFMRLCGYFIAEGGIHDDKDIYFAFNTNEHEYIEDVKKLMKDIFGLDNPCESGHNEDNGYQILYAHKILSNLFTNLFAPKEYQSKKGRGRKSNVVRIPPEFLNLPLEKLKEMIKSIWRGDGSYYKSSENCKKNAYEYQITTTSETLALQLTYILSKFNILTSIDLKFPKKENHSTAYDISILGQDIDIFEKIINEKNLNRESYRQINKYIKGNKIFYLPIKGIDIIRYNGTVFNLEVEEDNSYISTIALHNCYVPVEGKNIHDDMANDLRSIEKGGGVVVAQCRYGQEEMKKVGINAKCIYHGFNDKIFFPLKDKDIKYCYYSTDVGKVSTDPLILHQQGCYDCKNIKKDCPYFKEEIIAVLRYDDNKRWTQKDIEISKLKEEFKGKMVYLFVGQNFGLRKRIERLLKAYSMLIAESRQIKDGSILHLHTMPISIKGINLIKVIQDLGISKNVTFSYGSFRSSSWSEHALSILYNISDVNISASSSEGYGLPTLESMACGIPNIGPDCSSFTELIGNNEDKKPRGLLARIGEWQMIQDQSIRALVDEKDLANQMKIMYTKKDDRKIYSKNAIEWSKNHTWDKKVKEFDDLFKTMVS